MIIVWGLLLTTLQRLLPTDFLSCLFIQTSNDKKSPGHLYTDLFKLGVKRESDYRDELLQSNDNRQSKMLLNSYFNTSINIW